MNAAQAHLALNHVPIFATIVAVGVLAAGLVRKIEWLQRVGLWLFLVAAAATVPVYFTGEPAEEIVEHRPGVSETFIHPHEEAAELALIAVGTLAALCAAMLLLLFRGRRFPGAIWVVAFLAGIVTLALFARAAHLGGQIRHDELRPAGAPLDGTARDDDD